MAHVHGIGFRIVGESFAALPSAQRVTLSGFSQRNDPATGQVRDDYLYSVSVERHDWARIDLSALEMIDIVESLAPFELRRQMTTTGTFTPLPPPSPPPPSPAHPPPPPPRTPPPPPP